ncbi:MAG: hypothetical protein ACE367_04875 [Acidimicrobiales bacterium]
MDIDDDERRAVRRVIEAFGDRATPPPAFDDLRLAADGRPTRRPVRAMAVAASVAVVLVVAAIIGLNHTSDDSDEIVTTIDRPDTAEEPADPARAEPSPGDVDDIDSGDQAAAGACADDLAAFAGVLRTGLFPIDYGAAGDLDELVRRSDLVIAGTARSAVRSSEGSETWTLVDVEDIEVLHTTGGAAPPSTIAFSSVWTSGRPDPDPLGAEVTAGADIAVIAFLTAFDPAPGGYAVDPQGLFLACPATDVPPARALDPLPIEVGGLALDEVVAAIRSTSANMLEGWATAVDGPVVRWPESPTGGASGEAEVGGVVALEEGCLYLSEGDEVRHPVVWPAGTTWDPDRMAVILPRGTEVRSGDRVEGSGGFGRLRSLRQSRALGPEAIELLARCADGGDIASLDNDPGGVRACVVNAGENFCAQVTITD